ncbi:hypothetical protein [Sphingorhabdus sp. M41]|uniref:hypothetical protein n=1 Tax=Sphingorhabdus sp. M41 TaxID=1806885 RepID=UPI00078D3552|nr:hypothetical protein [Sphingorhabdus sp. M41]AMO72063.1 hypothetical protein AZE99_09570 [Sphingorhabdus sp. M41]
MGNEGNITGWITFFIGLYAVAAGVGEFRRPGFWAKMLQEFRDSMALQFLTGIVTLAVGATIYLVNPWNPGDLLSILISVLGAWIFIEGALILAVGDWFLNVASKMMSAANRLWAGVSIAVGLLAIFAALVRLQMP